MYDAVRALTPNVGDLRLFVERALRAEVERVKANAGPQPPADS